jgi:hypothetical protein
VEIFQIDREGKLFISPDIDSWEPILEHNITAIFDLDSGVDAGIPIVPDRTIYIYFPFEDKRGLPDLQKLHKTAQFGASLIESGYGVLSHCGMGHNRSALLAGVILTYLGITGAEAVTLLKQKRRGALYNKVFASYLRSLPKAQPKEHALTFRTKRQLVALS